jgi:hypothetical protein
MEKKARMKGVANIPYSGTSIGKSITFGIIMIVHSVPSGAWDTE